MTRQIQVGDTRTLLAQMASNSVDCVVTSPPYWGLRNYGVDGQIGLEASMGEYLESLVGVFADVRRVLKRSGTLWVNMGDCYVTDGGSGVQGLTGQRAGRRQHSGEDPRRGELAVKNLMGLPWRLAIALQDSGWFLRRDHVWEKPSATPESAKDRATTAHEYVFLLTKSAQYYFDPFAVMERTTGGTHSRGTSGRLSPKSTNDRHTTGIKNNSTYCRKHDGRFAMRNQRSVWRIAAQPFPDQYCTACQVLYTGKEKKLLQRDDKDRLVCRCGRVDAWLAHFATFPAELPRRCIAAGSSEHGCCVVCGEPWVRIVDRGPGGVDAHRDQALKDQGVKTLSKVYRTKFAAPDFYPGGERRLHKAAGLLALCSTTREAGFGHNGERLPSPKHVGWKKTCKCTLTDERQPALVLDPFAGAGTTLLVAERMGRASIGFELNPDYARMATLRIERELKEEQVA